MNLYLKSFFIVFTLLSLSACDWFRLAQERPIQKIPDGNKDIMEKALFSGSPDNPKYWLSRMTVVKKTFDGGDLGFVFPGLQGNVKAGYFQFERDQMIFCNRVSRKFLENEKTGRQVLCDKVYNWDIEHFATRLTEADGWTTNREEEDNYIPWDEKAFFKTKLNQTDLNSEISFLISPCWNLEKASLEDKSRVIEEDYISFIVKATYKLKGKCVNKKRANDQNFTATADYKYSFKRVSDPLKPSPHYTPYQFTDENDPLRDKYGYFLTVRPDFQSDRRDRNILYMNRWNPHKKHTFYFTKDYPEEYKYIAHGVICNTNKLFAKYGLNNYPLTGSCSKDGSVLPKKGETCSTGICFELKDNSGQELGDIRYSFFHMTDTPIRPLGYGPSNANPATGEIVNGTVVAGTRFLDYSIERALELIENEKTRYETSPVLTSVTQTLNIVSPNPISEQSHLSDRDIWTETSIPLSQNRKLFNEFVSFFHFSNPNSSRFTSAHLSNPGLNSPNLKDMLLSPLEKLEKNSHLSQLSNDLDFFKTSFANLFESEEQDFTNLIGNEMGLLEPSLDFSDPTQGTFFPIEFVEPSILSMAKIGMSKKEIKEKILFSLMSHEFGHVLNLRHNFYGSVDSEHYHEHVNTSSVMDYLKIKDERTAPDSAFFGPYDTAALIYAYSDGQIDLSEDQESNYLFCTDEDIGLNFLCQRFDSGSTVSEVTQDLIETYDELYTFRNFRDNRAYWGDRSYIYYIFRTMYSIKRPLGLLDLFETRKTEMSSFASPEEIEILEKDIKQAVKLSLSFYNSIIQLGFLERDWFNKYNPVSGSLESIGVFYDKIISTLFLMNDMAISENPNDPVFFTSYLPYVNDPDLKDIIKIVMENTLTQRVDNVPGFTSLAQIWYAQNSSNYFNKRKYPESLEKIGVRCYTENGLKERFKIDVKDKETKELETLFSLKIIPEFLEDSYYRHLLSTEPFNNLDQGHLRLGVIYRNGKYYTSLSEINAYSFSMIENLLQDPSDPVERRDTEENIYSLYLFYNSLKETPVSSIECDNGD